MLPIKNIIKYIKIFIIGCLISVIIILYLSNRSLSNKLFVITLQIETEHALYNEKIEKMKSANIELLEKYNTIKFKYNDINTDIIGCENQLIELNKILEVYYK